MATYSLDQLNAALTNAHKNDDQESVKVIKAAIEAQSGSSLSPEMQRLKAEEEAIRSRKIEPYHTVSGRAAELAKGFGRGLGSFAGSAVIGAGGLGKGYLGYGEGLEDIGKEIKRGTEHALAADEDYKGDWSSTVGETAGSIAPYLNPWSLGAALVGGALGGAGEAQEAAEKANASKEQQATAATKGLGAGILGAAVPTAVKGLSRLAKVSGEAAPGIKGLLQRTATGGAEGAAGMAAYRAGENLAEQGYNPNKKTGEGVVGSATEGGGVGAGVSLLLEALSKGKAKFGGKPSITYDPTGAIIPEIELNKLGIPDGPTKDALRKAKTFREFEDAISKVPTDPNIKDPTDLTNYLTKFRDDTRTSGGLFSTLELDSLGIKRSSDLYQALDAAKTQEAVNRALQANKIGRAHV